MGHSHATDHSHELAPDRARRVRLVLALTLLPFVLATVVGVIALWPQPVPAGTAPDRFLDQEGVDYLTLPVTAVQDYGHGGRDFVYAEFWYFFGTLVAGQVNKSL